MTRSIVFFAIAAAALAGCGGDSIDSKPAPAASAVAPVPSTKAATEVPEPATPPHITTFEVGESWRLIDASSPELRDNAVKAGIFLEVQDGRLVGYAGCNRFSAPMVLRGPGEIGLGPVMASKRGCADDALNAAEQQFLAALQKIDTFKLSDGQLSFNHPDGTVLVFVEGRPDGIEPAAE
jgi:heat shock protein HslJ